MQNLLFCKIVDNFQLKLRVVQIFSELYEKLALKATNSLDFYNIYIISKSIHQLLGSAVEGMGLRGQRLNEKTKKRWRQHC